MIWELKKCTLSKCLLFFEVRFLQEKSVEFSAMFCILNGSYIFGSKSRQKRGFKLDEFYFPFLFLIFISLWIVLLFIHWLLMLKVLFKALINKHSQHPPWLGPAQICSYKCRSGSLLYITLDHSTHYSQLRVIEQLKEMQSWTVNPRFPMQYFFSKWHLMWFISNVLRLIT